MVFFVHLVQIPGLSIDAEDRLNIYTMNPIIRNVLAVVAGWLIGSFINMGLIQLGHGVFPIEDPMLSRVQKILTLLQEKSYNVSLRQLICETKLLTQSIEVSQQ